MGLVSLWGIKANAYLIKGLVLWRLSYTYEPFTQRNLKLLSIIFVDFCDLVIGYIIRHWTCAVTYWISIPKKWRTVGSGRSCQKDSKITFDTSYMNHLFDAISNCCRLFWSCCSVFWGIWILCSIFAIVEAPIWIMLLIIGLVLLLIELPFPKSSEESNPEEV